MEWMKYRSFSSDREYDLRDLNICSTNAMRSFGMNYASSNKAKSKRKKNKRRRK